MSSLEIILVLFLTIFTIMGMSALAYLVVIMPMKEEIEDIHEKLRKDVFKMQFQQKSVETALKPPKNDFPNLDDLPESVWNVGDYGDDTSTPEEVEEEMSQVESAAKEAEQAWQDLEELKHGKSAPLIYGG